MPANEHGSSLVEALLVLPLIVLVVSATLLFLYLCFGKAWLDFQGYEAMMCLAERRPESTCIWHFYRNVTPLFPFGHLEGLRLGRRDRDLWFHCELHALLLHHRHHVVSDQHERLPL
jgi:hypothetical protein